MQDRRAFENPFDSNNRNHFPGYSPMFRIKKTGSPEKFQWSIDNIANLKPADIDPTGHNPEHDYSPQTEAELQRKSDMFFAQKTILPSPWLPSNAKPKHVTFSPCPPQTEYYDDEPSMESKTNPINEVSCQTVLTFPVDVDVEKLIGMQFFHNDPDDSDLANSSLRRKLFGKPNQKNCTMDTETHTECNNRSSTSITFESERGNGMEYSEFLRSDDSSVSLEGLVHNISTGPLHRAATALQSSFDVKEPFPKFLSPLHSTPSPLYRKPDAKRMTKPVLTGSKPPYVVKRSSVPKLQSVTPIRYREPTVPLSKSPVKGTSRMLTAGSPMTHIKESSLTSIKGPPMIPIKGPPMTPIKGPPMTPIKGPPITPIKGPYLTPMRCFASPNRHSPLPGTMSHTPFLSPITHYSSGSCSSAVGKTTSTPAKQGELAAALLTAADQNQPTEGEGNEYVNSDSEDILTPPPPAILKCEDLDDPDEGMTPTMDNVSTVDMSIVDASKGDKDIRYCKGECPSQYQVNSEHAGKWDSGMISFHPDRKEMHVQTSANSEQSTCQLSTTMDQTSGVMDVRQLSGNINSTAPHHWSQLVQDSDSGINVSRPPFDALSTVSRHQTLFGFQPHPTHSQIGHDAPSSMEPLCGQFPHNVDGRSLGSCKLATPTLSKPYNVESPACQETPKSRVPQHNYIVSNLKENVHPMKDACTSNHMSFSTVIKDILKKKDLLKTKLQRDPVVSLEASVGSSSPFSTHFEQQKRPFGQSNNTSHPQNGSCQGLQWRKPSQFSHGEWKQSVVVYKGN